jgi:uncharacterized protein (DUF302 family)
VRRSAGALSRSKATFAARPAASNPRAARNPKMAYQAIEMEPRVGAMLPCNVILREVAGGVEVSAIDPVASMQAIENAELIGGAGQVRDLLDKTVNAI